VDRPANANNVRYAPLILVPVSWNAGTATERFKVKWRQEELAANLSLEAFLDRAHSVSSRIWSRRRFRPGAYMAEVAEAGSLK